MSPRRDVLLYAVGIGSRDLRFIYEGHPDFAVFPTFPIRWGGSGAPIPAEAVPRSPGPLTIDAERYLEMIHPLPIEGTVTAKSRCIAIHPRGKGNGFVETETVLQDESGRDCFRLVNGSFRRGVEQLGDIQHFEGLGETFSAKITPPDRPADVDTSVLIPDNQAHMYRLSGVPCRHRDYVLLRRWSL